MGVFTLKRILPIFQKNKIIAGILLLGLIHGLLYVFIVPVWEHYDEPGNFEYAWLLAHRPGLPEYGSYDLAMRQAVLSSLINSRFFDYRGFPFGTPSLSDNPPWIGAIQVGDPPLYYWLAALPMRVLPPLAVETQLYAGRLVSLVMYLLTILAAWGLMGEVLPPRHALRWMVPATLALLPGFADIMTSVNSDVGAVMVYTLWLWACLRLMRRGLSLPRLIIFLLAAAACIFTKRTVYLVVVIAPLGLLLALVKGRWRILVWGLFGLSCVAVMALLVTWDDPAFWYRTTNQAQSGRVVIASQNTLPQPTGEFALQTAVEREFASFSVGFSQVLPNVTAAGLAGKTVTVAGWIWASVPIQVTAPALDVFKTTTVSWMLKVPITLDVTPRFFAVHYTIPSEGRMIVMTISPGLDSSNASNVMVYYKDLILVEGEYPTDQIPQFTDSSAEGGAWGDQPFTNLLSNASMQAVWPRFNGKLATPLINKLGVGYTTYGLIPFVLDSPRYSGYLLLTIENNFRSFWAKFGWGQVVLLGYQPYLVLGIFSLAGILGASAVLIKGRRKIPWGMVAFICLVGGLSWVYTLAIGVVLRPLVLPGFITSARYAYPAIVPSALVLNAGWWGVGILASRLITRKHRLPQMTGKLIFFGLFLFLDAYSFISIIRFFR
jgi:hypothetical protein